MEMELDFSGVSSHGSAPQRGDNAIYKGSRAALAVSELNHRLAEDSFLGRGTVTVTRITSDSPSLCSVPDRCSLHLDRRLTWGETIDSAVGEVLKVAGGEVKISVPEFREKSYTGVLFPQKAYFPTWKIAEDHVLVRAGVRTFQSLFEKEPERGKWVFSTNGVSICGTHKIPAIGFGPGDERGAHAPNEKVPVAHLQSASAFYALFPYVLEEAL
jgi:putative selenium metabolism hydrolase